MTLRHMRIFLAVCENQSVTRAAESLFMSQPAVSLAIKELEAHYGVKLFDRMTRRMCVTADGKRMLEYAAPLVKLFDELERSIKNTDAAGELRVGGSISIGACLLPGYIKRLTERFSELKPHVRVDNSNNIVKAVGAGELDVGLVEGAVRDEALIVRPFMQDRLIAVCGRGHPFAAMAQVDLDDFLAQPLLLRERGSGTRELFQSAVTLMDRKPLPTWESISTTALIRATEAGAGVSVLPERLTAEYIAAGRLSPVHVDRLNLKRSYYLIYHRNKYLSAGLRGFIDIVMSETLD